MGEGRLWQDRSADGVAATRYLMGRRLGKLMQGSQLRNQEVRLVPCPACHSVNRRDFTAEINIHFPGMKGIDIPTVLLCSTVLVCVECGMAQFLIPEAERGELADRDCRVFTD